MCHGIRLTNDYYFRVTFDHFEVAGGVAKIGSYLTSNRGSAGDSAGVLYSAGSMNTEAFYST